MIAVIGDIHGCFYTLLDIFNAIKVKYKKIEIYTVGDLIDRGNYSFQVMQFVYNEGIKFTPGNHEFMFYHSLSGIESTLSTAWAYNGREQTVNSYNGKEEYFPIHIEMIKRAPLYYNLEDCFISHAGVSNYFKEEIDNSKKWLKIDEIIYDNKYNEHGVLRTRDELYNLNKLQIVGHTKQDEIKLIEDSNAIYIDTGCCVGGGLSAVIIDKNKVYDVIKVPTRKNDIDR